MSAVTLSGSVPPPLLAYLKALGVFRVIASQHDPEATARWRGGALVIEGPNLDADSVVAFFADRYAPSPIVSPWNSRGGFRTDRMQSSEKLVAAIEASSADRLGPYRDVIGAVRRVRADAVERGLVIKEEVGTKQKRAFLEFCRGNLPDEALDWFDAAVVVLDDEKVAYPALLGGTGGNLGSGDLSSNYMEAVLDITGAARRAASPELNESRLRFALFGTGSPKLAQSLPGQFDPAGAGGLNVEGRGKVANPWDFVLGMEGALFFTAGSARRLGAHAASAAVPFTAPRSRPGATPGASDEENIRAEIWLPEWDDALSRRAVEHLFHEARMQWNRDSAASNIDFARAAATLGVDRQITSFTRYLVAERFGLSNLALPVGRVSVRARSSTAVETTAQLDRWIGAVRRIGEPPASVRSLRNLVDRAQIDVALRPTASRLLDLLTATAKLEQAVGRSAALWDRVTVPVREIRAEDWVPHLELDATPERRIARAVASARDRLRPGPLDQPTAASASMAVLLRPIHLDRRSHRPTWSSHRAGSGLIDGRTTRALVDAIGERNLRSGQSPRPADDADSRVKGVRLAWDHAWPCDAVDVHHFAAGLLDEQLIADHLLGLCLLDWRKARPASGETRREAPSLRDPVVSSLAPFVNACGLPVEDDSGHTRWLPARLDGDTVPALASGRTAEALAHAGVRYQQFGFDFAMRPTSARPIVDAAHALAALTVPMTAAAVMDGVRAVCPSPNPPSAEHSPLETA